MKAWLSLIVNIPLDYVSGSSVVGWSMAVAATAAAEAAAQYNAADGDKHTLSSEVHRWWWWCEESQVVGLLSGFLSHDEDEGEL